MPDALSPRQTSFSDWTGDLTRVPFWVYRDQALMKVEQDRVFEGPVWNFLCLEDEIANPGDWRATVVGQMPVVVARDADGSIAAFENRCAHRGALICLDNAGSGAKDFQCVYHAWRYDLRGNLRSVAFQRGVNGKGGHAGRLPDGGSRPAPVAHNDAARPGVRHVLRPTRRRSRTSSAPKCWRGSTASSAAGSSRSSGASSKCCRTTGRCTRRTRAIPIMPACCICFSPRSS